jgi:hypothetical protein
MQAAPPGPLHAPPLLDADHGHHHLRVDVEPRTAPVHHLHASSSCLECWWRGAVVRRNLQFVLRSLAALGNNHRRSHGSRPNGVSGSQHQDPTGLRATSSPSLDPRCMLLGAAGMGNCVVAALVGRPHLRPCRLRRPPSLLLASGPPALPGRCGGFGDERPSRGAWAGGGDGGAWARSSRGGLEDLPRQGIHAHLRPAGRATARGRRARRRPDAAPGVVPDSDLRDVVAEDTRLRSASPRSACCDAPGCCRDPRRNSARSCWPGSTGRRRASPRSARSPSGTVCASRRCGRPSPRPCCTRRGVA